MEFSKAPKSMEVSFKSKGSPLIYGISLEGKRGVVVDNIPLRGASGTEFGKVDYKSLKQILLELKKRQKNLCYQILFFLD